MQADEEPPDKIAVDYAGLRANTPKAGKRAGRSKAFGKGAVMRLDASHSERANGYTHMCTYPLEKNDKGEVIEICGNLLKIGYDQKREYWITTRAIQEMSTHEESAAGASALKRQSAAEAKVVDTAFTYGMQMQSGANAAAKAGVQRAKSGGFESFTLSAAQVELSSAALMFVYGRQRISKAFDLCLGQFLCFLVCRLHPIQQNKQVQTS